MSCLAAVLSLAAACAAPLADYAGDYWEDHAGFAGEVAVAEGKLWAVHSPTRSNELRPEGTDTFRMVGAPGELPGDIIVYFDREAGLVTGMHTTLDGRPHWSFRRFTRHRLDPARLAAYAGRYNSPELGVTYSLEPSGDRLLFRTPDRSGLELTPMFGETFEHSDYGGFTFERNAAGQVTGFVLARRQQDPILFERE